MKQPLFTFQTEAKVISKGANLEPYERPFQKQLAPLTEDVSIKIEYPSEDEQFGMVSIGWRVPGKLWDSMFTVHALRVLAGYMSSSAIRCVMIINRFLTTNVTDIWETVNLIGLNGKKRSFKH